MICKLEDQVSFQIYRVGRLDPGQLRAFLWGKAGLVLLCKAIGSQLNCYSWCGFPFRCLENDSADHIHILKYFLRTCNQTAGTDSFCSAQPPHSCSRIDSSQRQKYQGLRTQAANGLFIWGKQKGKSRGAWGKNGSGPRRPSEMSSLRQRSKENTQLPG